MIDEEDIKKQAKAIMDDFMKALGKIEVKGEEFGIERRVGVRNAGKGCASKNFRKLMFENAPRKNEDYIIMEKKKW